MQTAFRFGAPRFLETASCLALRDFLARTFTVREVESVELRRAKAFGRVSYGAVRNPSQIWKKLSQALRRPSSKPNAGDEPELRVDATFLYLDAPGATTVNVTRIGSALTTWRLQGQTENTLRISHPFLRNRRDVVFRLEEELAAILGVESFRASAVSGRVSIRFDKAALTAERLARELEKAWPRLLKGLDGPPSQKRYVASVGLLGLAFTGQYLVPAVRPIAVAGVLLYSSPNVVGAVKQLKRGEVGIYVMYTTGLSFLLISGMPFASTVIAVLMQLWPDLARRKLIGSQRRVFAGQRRRPAWVRIPQSSGRDVELSIDELRTGDRITVRHGEIVAVDGVIEEGFAAVVDEAAFGGDQVEDKSTGDAVAAGAFVRDGSLTLRVERAGAQTVASYIDSLLPHAAIAGMPSSSDVERIANRNAKPALAASALSFFLTRTLRPSQALIRPDYATAPRLSAQLSALHGVAGGLQRGVLFRNPAALDRLAECDVYVIDDSAGLDRKRIAVAKIYTTSGVSGGLIVDYASAAHAKSPNERGRALAQAAAANRKRVQPNAEPLSRHAGVTRYRDKLGSLIEIATSAYLAASKIDVPTRFRTAPPRHDEPGLRPLWVLRDGAVIGGVSFARTGEPVGRQVLASLKALNPRARIVYVSRAGDAEAKALGIEFAYGGLSPTAKLELVRGIGRQSALDRRRLRIRRRGNPSRRARSAFRWPRSHARAKTPPTSCFPKGSRRAPRSDRDFARARSTAHPGLPDGLRG